MDQLGGLVDKQGLATRKATADLTLAERKATAPISTGPKAKSPEEIARQANKDALVEEQLKQLRGKPGNLTSGEVESVIELQGAQKLLDDLSNLKKTGGKGKSEINTGPIENIIGWAAGKIGLQSPEWTTFKATAGTQLAEYIKGISGATVSEPERVDLLENVPTPSDDDEEFVAKLKAVNDMLTTKLATKRKAYQATGKDTSIFGAGAAPAKPISEMTEEEIDVRIEALKGKR